MAIEISVGVVGVSDCTDDGLDVDVQVTLADGRVVDGELTLRPAEDGRLTRDGLVDYRAWGMPDHWVSDGLLCALSEDDLHALETAGRRACCEHQRTEVRSAVVCLDPELTVEILSEALRMVEAASKRAESTARIIATRPPREGGRYAYVTLDKQGK